MIKYIISRTRLSIGILSATLVLTVILEGVQNQFQGRVDRLRGHLSSLDQLTNRSHEVSALIKIHEKDFAAFEACKFEQSFQSEGLPKSQIYSIDLGSAECRDHLLQNKNLVFQEVSFSLSCLQDREVFAVLEKLMQEGPGIFQVREVTIIRKSPLSDNTLEKIAAGIPQTLFIGRVLATWVHR